MVPLVAKALGGFTCLEDFPLNFASRVLDVVLTERYNLAFARIELQKILSGKAEYTEADRVLTSSA